MILKLILLFFFITIIVSIRYPCTRFSNELEENRRGCSWYWRCRGNDTNLLAQPTEEMCPHFQHFNPETQQCGPASETCQFDEINFNLIPTQCPPWRQDFIPHFWYCNRYFLCFEGKSKEFPCDEGNYFSYYQNGCINEFLADCRVEDYYCRHMKANNYRARGHPFECTQYHVCNECNRRYTLKTLHCVNGTHEFDDRNQQCDDASRVKCAPSSGGGGGSGGPPGGGCCGGGGTTGSTISTTPSYGFPDQPHSHQCTDEDIRREFVGHPTSCFHFFNCASGKSRLISCPYGSHFDWDKNQCWRHNDSLSCRIPGASTTPMTPTLIRT